MTRPDELGSLPVFEIEEAAPRTLLVRLRGDVDAGAAARLRDDLDREFQDTPFACLLIDLSRVALLGSEALDLLLELRRRCRVENRHVVLVGTGCPAVHRPLLVSGLLPLFDTRLTLQAALHRPALAPVRYR